MHIKKLILATSLSFIFFSGAYADIRTVAVSELEPENKHFRASELITHIVTTYHYKKTELDDRLSSLIFDHYLENLDQNKSYFLKQDIKEFEEYRFKIDDAFPVLPSKQYNR